MSRRRRCQGGRRLQVELLLIPNPPNASGIRMSLYPRCLSVRPSAPDRADKLTRLDGRLAVRFPLQSWQAPNLHNGLSVKTCHKVTPKPPFSLREKVAGEARRMRVKSANDSRLALLTLTLAASRACPSPTRERGKARSR